MVVFPTSKGRRDLSRNLSTGGSGRDISESSRSSRSTERDDGDRRTDAEDAPPEEVLQALQAVAELKRRIPREASPPPFRCWSAWVPSRRGGRG